MLTNLFFFLLSAQHRYYPDVRIGIKRKSTNCTHIVNGQSHIFCHIIAQVADQAIPIVNTYSKGEMVSFKMNSNNVIDGFKKGLLGACQGEIRKITIPAERAYGDGFVYGLFPPGSSWYTEVEIVEVMNGDLL